MNKKLIGFLLAWASMLGISNVSAAESKIPPLSEADRAQLRTLFKELSKIGGSVNDVYCQEEYKKFSDYDEKYRTKWGEKLPKIIRYYEIAYETGTRHSDKNEPTESECISVITNMGNILENHTSLIEKAYKAIPINQKEEKEQPTDWKKEMQEVYDEKLETEDY